MSMSLSLCLCVSGINKVRIRNLILYFSWVQTHCSPLIACIFLSSKIFLVSTSPFIYPKREFMARLVVVWGFFFSKATLVFFIRTLISAPALSIFALILKNSKAGSKESKLSLQKANSNYLTTSSDKFGIEMARKPGSPDRAVLWFKPTSPFPPTAVW